MTHPKGSVPGRPMLHKPRSPRRVATATVPIQDLASLMKLFTDYYARFGSDRKAARHLGISPTLFRRVKEGKSSEVSRQNALRLIRGIDSSQRKKLLRSFVRRSPALLRRDYVKWISEQRDIASRGSEYRWFRTAHGLSDERREDMPTGESDRDKERRALWRYAKEVAPAFTESVITAFQKARDRQYFQLALIRMLDPLINAPDTAFIEPSWREWRATRKGRMRLLKFLRAGFKREELMLKVRLHTTERALNLLALDYDEFLRIYGESAKPLKAPREAFGFLDVYFAGEPKVK